jgi:hypothetical protein
MIRRIAAAVALVGLIAVGCGDDGGDNGTSARQDSLQGALEDADPTEFGAVADLEVKRIERSPTFLQVTLATPEGGFEGASVDDLDGSAGAAFKAIYGDTDWRKDASVTFTGGLVDTRTGKEAPNEETGIYRLTASEARRIEWDNAVAVDWSQYRVFAHPALKGA